MTNENYELLAEAPEEPTTLDDLELAVPANTDEAPDDVESGTSKEGKKHRKAEKDAKHWADKEADIRACIEEHDIYCLLEGDWWIINAHSSSRYFIKPYQAGSSFPHVFNNENGERQVANRILFDMGRTKARMSSSFNQLPPAELNLLEFAQDDFVQLEAGKTPHPLIRALILSVAGGKEENRKHIEHLIWYKWKHPENYRLPALIISGEGAIGKNVFAEKFLSTVFGGRHMQSTISNLTEKFNDHILGKAVVYIDESHDQKMNPSALRRFLGNETFDYEKKYGPKVSMVPATAMYLIGSNEATAVALRNDSSDRRYSIIFAPANQTLFFYIARDILGLEWDSKSEFKSDIVPQCQTYWDNNEHVLSDPTEIGKWLYTVAIELADTWDNKVPFPTALHGDDFEEAIERNKPSYQAFCDEVLLAPAFSHIQPGVFYQWYREYHAKEQGHASRYSKGKRAFFVDAQNYIESDDRFDHIEWTLNGNLRKDDLRIRVSLIINTNLNDPGTTLAQNDGSYLVPDEFGKDVLITVESFQQRPQATNASQKVVNMAEKIMDRKRNRVDLRLNKEGG